VFAADLSHGSNWTLGAVLTSIQQEPHFSANGRFATYVAVTNNSNQVFLYDFLTGSNRLISQSFSSTAGGNGASDWPQISSNGRFLAYRSRATDLTPNASNDLPRVVLFDQSLSITTLLSANRTGNANNRSLTPCFSADSQSVCFESLASDLVDGDLNGASDLFAFRLAVESITDLDGDGMDDQWELAKFGTLARDGIGDFDNDGASDLFEFQSGTDPTDPASRFHLEISINDGGNPNLTWQVAPGRSYKLQFKRSLDEQSWNDFPGHIVTAGDRAFACELESASSQRFYRVLMFYFQL